ncbi:hypothetical protein [Streptomyces sp. NPDC059861]
MSARLLFSVQKELLQKLAEQGHPRLRPQHGALERHPDPGTGAPS